MRHVTRRQEEGYTLVELIVSVAIFAVVMLSATSAYLAFINYNRRAVQYGGLMNSLSFAVDGMMRDIRTGTLYACDGAHDGTSGCVAGGNDSINFLDANGCEVEYAFTGSALTKRTEATKSGCRNRTTTLLSPAVTPGITLSSVAFYVRGEEEGDADKMQPIATAVLKGTTLIVDTGEEVEFSIQTSGTSRVPDL